MTTLFSGEQLSLELSDGCARLVFANPAAFNALTVTMANECQQATEVLLARDDVRILVLQGSGKAFMAGGDLRAMQEQPVQVATAIIEAMHRCIADWQRAPWLVLACVQGAVAGAGLSLVAAADLVLAADDVRFVYAYSDIATTCDLGLSWHLPRRIGSRRVLEMALLGRNLDAVSAIEWGLVNQVAPRAGLEDALQVWLERLNRYPAGLLPRLKALLRDSPVQSLEQQLDSEREAFIACAAEPDFCEAISAFFARRA